MEIKLSKTSKMNCNSWSTEALNTCNRGKVLAKKENSVCSLCYACTGAYRFPSTINRRVENIAQYNAEYLGWIAAMSEKINKLRKPLFRWFDSGDLKDKAMLEAIIHIALNNPSKKFWLPTREIGILESYFNSKDSIEIPSNLNIRISADYIGHDVENADYFKSKGCTFSTVEIDINRDSEIEKTVCHATVDKSGNCGTCSKCWNKSVDCISYKLH